MTQIKRQMRLVRVPDAFLPAALAVAAFLRPAGSAAIELYIATFIVSALSLFASRGIRIAFAQQPAIRHVRGSVKCALLATLIGGGIAAGVFALFKPLNIPDPLPLILSGCLLNIEHVFYEYMYAIGDRRSAALARGLTALFTLAGLLLYSAGSTLYPLRLAGMTALAVLVSLVISLVMGDGARGRLDASVLRCAPRSALQTALYPAAALGLFFLFNIDRVGLPFFAGLTLYELCKTPFRRSPLESRPFNRSLLIVCAAAGLVWLAAALIPLKTAGAENPLFELWRMLPNACAMVLTAAACAFALFGNIHGKDA